jgi:hypothetical protein
MEGGCHSVIQYTPEWVEIPINLNQRPSKTSGAGRL